MRTTDSGYFARPWAIAVVMAQVIFCQSSPPSDPAPLYVESSIVNAASPAVGQLAPNTLATVYGRYLSETTRAATADDVRSGVLPTVLPGTSVRVLIGGQAAPLLYVSPGQINFLVPSTLLPGRTDLRVGRNSLFGPAVPVGLVAAAPALFLLDPEFAIATRGTDLLTAEVEAAPGDVVTLYATGLGDTKPRPEPGQIVRTAASITRLGEFRVQVDGMDAEVLYAGLAPGFAGLYQINLRLPDIRTRNPDIRIGFMEMMSPPGIRLHAGTKQPAAARTRPGFQLDLFQERYAPNCSVSNVAVARRDVRRR